MSVANQGYLAMNRMLKLKLLTKEFKVNPYTTYLRPITAYECETWSTTKGNEEKLLRFERKILRKIYRST